MHVRSWMLALGASAGLVGAGGSAQAQGVAGQAEAHGFVVKPASEGDYQALAKLPDLSGVWQPDWGALFSGRGGRRPVDVPPFTPTAKKVVDDFAAGQKEGKNLQTEMANCMPAGMPQIMRMPYPIEFLYTPGRVTILIETDHQIRRIYTDGRPLPEDPDPAFNGSSVGHWEGDTLVVETSGLNAKTSLLGGLHPTENTKLRETFHLDKPDLLVIRTTITDPALFSTPFEQLTPYSRKRDWQIREYVCEENNRDAADPFGRPSMTLDDDEAAAKKPMAKKTSAKK